MGLLPYKALELCAGQTPTPQSEPEAIAPRLQVISEVGHGLVHPVVCTRVFRVQMVSGPLCSTHPPEKKRAVQCPWNADNR